MTKENLENLINTQQEYIELLEKVCKDNAKFLFANGYLPDQKDVDAGVYLREQLKLLKLDEKPIGPTVAV
jgi:hypothetical protein